MYPNDWYWQAVDGRVFASARGVVITTIDAVFQAWLAAGHVPTSWPRDDAGNQTDAALQDVLTPLGLFVSMAAYASAKRRATIAAGTTVSVGGAAIPTWADADTQAALTALVVAAGINPGLTTTWRGRDGTFYPLDAAGVISLATGIMGFVQSAFAVEALAAEGASAGTIITRADVDALAWPT